MPIPNSSLEIKAIRVKDHYDTVYNMMLELHHSEQEMFDKAASWQDIGKNYMQHVIAAQEENDGTFLIAYIADQPAGFIFGYTEEQDDSRIEIYTGTELYISDGFVHPTYRRQGIYKQLNDKIEALYIHKGIRRISRFTLATNNRMQAFLSGSGYRPTRVIYEKWLSPDGTECIPLQLQPPAKPGTAE
jgi:ribosomal protein S18 acetylase RimI-like enzyme